MLKHALVFTAALLVGGGLLAACGGGGQEAAFVRGFFTASRYEDRTTLGNMSMVVFSPQEEGIASSPSIDNVTEEQSRPLRMRELRQALDEVQAEEETFRAEKKAYQDENTDAITRVIEAARDSNDVARRDEEVKETWDQLVADERDFAREVSDALNALNAETVVAERSVYDPSNPLDVVQYDGVLVSKDVTVTASMTKDGESAERTMVFTLQKVDLEGEDGIIDGRWIITAIE
jgi:hypothetical protein